MNLDGSAAWQGHSADEILDEFLEPFQQGIPTEDIVHVLAINDGRLLEWIENGDESPLTQQLYEAVQLENKHQLKMCSFQPDVQVVVVNRPLRKLTPAIANPY